MSNSSSSGKRDSSSSVPDIQIGSLAILDAVLYPAVFLPLILYYSLYTLKQGSTRDLVRVMKQRLGWYPEKETSRSGSVWIHGVSVGEVNCIPPIVNELERESPDLTPVITTSTLTGFRMAREHFPDREVLFFPIDFPGPVRRAFRHIRPNRILLVEQEIWPNFIRESVHRDVPVAVVNARMTERSAKRFGRVPSRIRNRMFKPLTAVLAQNEAYARRFRQLGVDGDRIEVTGNVKYDALLAGIPDESELEDLRVRYGITEDQWTITGGSIHPPEHEPMLDALESLREQSQPARLVLAPRHLKNADRMYRDARNRGFKVCFDGERNDRQDRSDSFPDVIVVDRMGLLMTLYGVSDLVFVGGSLVDHGGQNMLEPAAHGKPILIGPRTYNFKEEVRLLQENGGILQVSSEQELSDLISNLDQHQDSFQEMGDHAQKAVLRHQGAARRSIRHLFN